MTKLNIPSFLLFSVLVSSSLGVFGQFNQLKVDQIKPIEPLNTKGEENVPVVNNAGDEMYFMRTYVGKKKRSKAGQEIWSSYFDGEQWESPSPKLLSVNDNANNAVIGISEDSKRLYLFNSLDTRHKLAKGLGYVEMDESGEYGSPIGIDIPGFEVGNGYYSFYVTPDEQQFFIATAHDSTGFEDLFVSLRQVDGSWGQIINLGNQINTPTIETTPFLTEDKRILYFSSDGHGGEGQADIFYTERIGEGWSNWSKPVNMGRPINSEKFDANFILIDQERAIFSSNRSSELSDLYEIYFRKKTAPMPQTEEQLAALDLKGYLENKPSIQLKTLEDGMVEGSINEIESTSMANGTDGVALIVRNEKGEVVDTVYADQNGKFKFKQLPSEKLTLSLLGSEDEELLNVKVEDLISQAEHLASVETRINRIKASGIKISEDSITGMVRGLILLEKLNPNRDGLTPVIIKNELGETVDTLFADAAGKFIYKKLPGEQVSLALMGGADDEEMLMIPLDDLIAVSMLAEFEMEDKSTNTASSADAQQIAEESEQVVSEGRNNEIAEKLLEKEAAVKPQSMVENNKHLSREEKESESNEQVQLKIYFAFDSYAIQDTATNRIDAIINSLNRSAIESIKVTGYTDTSGPSLYNDLLSKKRAQTAKDYLIKKGLSASSISVDAKGEKDPDFPNDTRRGRILNRRVKVAVVYKY